MNFNTSFVIGMIIGAILFDYTETKIRAYKANKPIKKALLHFGEQPEDDSAAWRQYLEIEQPKKVKTVKPLTSLRAKKGK